MASSRGLIRLTAVIIGLALLCVLAYNVLLFLVTPHPVQVDAAVPSGLPDGSQVTDGGYIVVPAYNVTPEQRAALAGANDTVSEVSFLQLPLWIQLNVLPWILVGAVTSFFAMAAVAGCIKNNRNDNTQGVLTFIQGSPGCTAPEIARGENMNIGTVRYHVKKLQDEGRIVLAKIGKFSRIFVKANAYDDREKRIAACLHNDACRQVLGAILEARGISNQELADKLGMEKSLVYRHLQKLQDDGIVAFEQEGRRKLYYIDAGAREAFLKLMPLHYQCPGLKKE